MAARPVGMQGARIGAAVLVAAAAVGIVGGLYWQQSRPEAFVVSGFIEADEIRVGSRVGGRVAEVLVEEGDRVSAGQPLYRIDPLDLRERQARARADLAARQAELAEFKAGFRVERIAEARARREAAAANLAKLVAGPRPREIQIARERVKLAQASLELAESEHKRVTDLGANATKTELDRVTRELKAARAQLGTAENELALLEEGSRAEDVAEARATAAALEQALRLLEAGYRPEQIAQAAARVAAAQADLDAIARQLDELTVVAPRECVVEAIDLRPGDLVAPNAPSVSLLDESRLWVRAYVPEPRLARIAHGQRAAVHVHGLHGSPFAGRVTYIARAAEFTPRNVQTPEERSKQVFRVKVTLDDAGGRLRVGMSADVQFDEAAPSASAPR